ncbi:MAG: hypothetical protein ACPF83_10170 [Flavobacteriales bacterium]
MRVLTLLVLLCGLFLQTHAQVGAEHSGLNTQAAELFAAGNYAEALPLYSQLVSLYPRDAELNYRFGTCALLGGEEKATAIKHLNFGARKGGPVEAWYYLGLAHHRNYDFQAAEEAYVTFQRKADDKLESQFPVARQMVMCRNGKGLLSSITDVVVLDKTASVAEEFFRFYDMTGIGGKILATPEDLQTKTDRKEGHVGVIHFPKGSNVIYFSSYGSSTKTGKDIYQATILDGKFIDIKKLAGPVNTGFDEDFPFMHPDGETLYFASKGHNSMGGYDIFMCKLDKSTGTWLPPVNLDFAINTPDDDLFYVADSLNQRAFFASARSSAQSHLHVYEVLVQGIPVNLIFLQGTFLNELPEGSRKAKIEIVDELTGRPVAQTTTDPITGEYLFSMPKSGLYQVRVEAESSLYRHEGQIELPIVDASVAFKQELKLIDESGQEKLIINNHFDTPLDVDIAALSQEYLRGSAALDINASDERIAEAQSVGNRNNGQVLDTGAQPHWGAGFSQDQTLEEVFADSRAQADALEEEAAGLDSLAQDARSLSAFQVQQAQEAVDNAREVWSGADPSDRDQYMAIVKAYAQALKAADEAKLDAEAALEAARAMEQFAKDKRREATDVRTQMDTAERAWAAGDGKAAEQALRWEKDRQNDLTDGEDTPSNDDREKAHQLQQKQLEVLDDLSDSNSDFDKLKRDQRRLEEELAAGPKKSRQNEIEAELEALAVTLEDLQASIDDDKHRVTKLSTEELTLLRKAALFDALRDGSAEFPEGFDPSEVRAGTVADDLRNLERDIAGLERNNDVLIALASEETIKTRNDISRIPALQARAESLGIPIQLSAELRTQAQPFLAGWDGEPGSYQRRTGLEMIQRTARQQQRVLDMVAPEIQDSEQAAALAEEQEALKALLSSLDRQLNLMPLETLVARELNVVAAASLVMPDFDQRRQLIVQESQSDLERSIREQTLRTEVSDALEAELVATQQALLNTDDAMAQDGLAQEIEDLKAGLLAVNGSTEDITNMKAAYESESAAIVASDDIFREKMGEQIRLGERYRDALMASRTERTNALNRTSDPVLRAAIQLGIGELDAELAATDARLTTYSTDLENALQVAEGADLISAGTGAETSGASNASEASNPNQNAEPEAIADAGQQEGRTEVGQLSDGGDSDASAATDIEAEQATLVVEGSEVATTNELTREEALLLTTTIYPSFDQAIRSAVSNNNDGEANRLLSELDDRVTREMAEQEGLREALDDPFLLQEIDAEIQDLSSLRAFAREGLEVVANAGAQALDLPGSTEPVVDTEAVESTPAPFVPERATGMASNGIDKAREARSFLEDPIYENYDAVEVLRAEVGVMRMDLRAEDRKSMQKALKKDIAKKEAELAKEELTYQDRVGQKAQLVFASNNTHLDSLESLFAEQLAFVNSRKESVTMYRSDAQMKMDEAAKLRIQANETKDEVERNGLLNAALGLEVQAMELQEDAMEVFVPFEGMLDSPEEILVDTSPRNTDPSEADATETSGVLASETTTDSTPAETTPFTLVDVVPFEPVEVTGSVNDWARDNGIIPEALESMADSPDLIPVNQAFENVRVAEKEVNALRRERATLQAEVNTFRSALATGDLDAETRATLEADATTAETQLRETEAAIESAEGRLERYQEEAFLALADANIAARAEAAIEAGSTAQPESETAGEEATTLPEIPANVAAELPATPPAAPEVLLVMPEVLEQPVFALVETPLYSESRTIPINTARPAGVVYCVQVGAYRNAIPQDLFAEFAPIYGDELQNGIIRYTAGLFLQYANADQAKKAIRELGYKDAFVVAYRDGERVSLRDAREATGDIGPVAATPLPTESRSSDAVETSPASRTGSGGDLVTGSESDIAAATITSQGATPAEVLEAQPTYNVSPGAALATPVEALEGVFFTVQVGVYSKPVTAADLRNIAPLNTELLDGGRIRYTTGQYANLGQASLRKDQIRARGIADAFVTAYVNGKRTSVSEARQWLEGGQAAPVESTVTPQANNEAPITGYEVIIGSFRDEIPAEVAQAMLFLEGEYGIRQRQVDARTEYYTEAVATRDQAESIRDAFRKRGVDGLLIQPIR